MKNTKVTLSPLTENDREQFILDNQESFKFGATEEFGMRDDHMDDTGEIISRETIERCMDDPQNETYRIMLDGRAVGGVILKIDKATRHNHLEILFTSPREHSRGIGYTFDYESQPSRALFKYREAFRRNDRERYAAFLKKASLGLAHLHTGTLTPYDIVAACIREGLDAESRTSLDTTWRTLVRFVSDEDAIAVVDGSGSMFWDQNPVPAAVAMSLGIYLAEHNTGRFAGHFITFSEDPQLVKIKGKDIYEKVQYCMQYDECGGTDIEKVFMLILGVAVKNALPQSRLPKKLYIISDMEFNDCAVHASLTNFENAKKQYAAAGYELPTVVFWNVNSRSRQQPVTMNEQGAILVSGASPRVFGMLKSGILEPLAFMNDVLSDERYRDISA